jgi:UDP-glucose 4-epimerase
MTRIFITGGAGFIGSHTVEALLRKGNEVVVYDVKPWKEAINLHHLEGKVVYVEGDICQYELLLRSMKGCSQVLHLAAVVAVQETIANPRHAHDVNVSGTLNVFESARQLSIPRVVYASSAAVYGASNDILNEDAHCQPLSPYGLHKLINDEYAALFATLHGQSFLGLRYFNVFGPRQDPASPYSGVVSIFRKHVTEKLPVSIFGDGEAVRDFVSVYDVAEANSRALMSEAAGVLNIGSGTTTSINELIAVFEAVTGSAIEKKYLPSRVGDITHSATLIDNATKALQFTPAITLKEGITELLTHTI